MSQVRLLGFFLVAGVAVASWGLTCVAWQFDQVAAGVRPLEPRSFPELTLVAAGTGGAWENPDRLGPLLAVGLGDDLLLVDAGRGAAEALRRAQIPLAQAGTVLVGNLMAENTVGLDDLALAGRAAGRTEPLAVLGPPGTAALAASLETAHAAAARAGREALGWAGDGPLLAAQEVGEGFSLARGELSVRAASLPGGPLETLAWRFEARGRALVIAPHGFGHDRLAEFAQGAQVLVQEAAAIPSAEEARELGLGVDPDLLGREAALHTSIDAVGALAHRAGVGTLVLVRLRPPPVYDFQITSRVDDRFDGRIILPADGDELIP